MAQGSGDEDSPSGRIEPTSEAVLEVREQLADQEFESALESIEDLDPEEGIEEDWVAYFRGLGLLGSRRLDEAFEAFQERYSRIVSSASAELTADRFRIAAKCLKKMGWYHRRGKGFERAYTCHSMEYDLLAEHGSNLEVHDAALSLDVVAYNLRAPQVSKMWLERSVEAAEGIDNESFRAKALGLSWNNLAGTLCDVEEFEEATEAAETSLEHWETYEELSEGSQNRTVWARHIIGDAYKRWGDDLAEAGAEEEATEHLEHAREVLDEAVREAERREMGEEERADIRGKLEDVHGALEELGVEVSAEGADEEGVREDGENSEDGESE